jgi:hypothetical protein
MVSAPDNKPMALNFAVSERKFKDKFEERECVKERLALAYRVLAHEKLCECDIWYVENRLNDL